MDLLPSVDIDETFFAGRVKDEGKMEGKEGKMEDKEGKMEDKEGKMEGKDVRDNKEDSQHDDLSEMSYVETKKVCVCVCVCACACVGVC